MHFRTDAADKPRIAFLMDGFSPYRVPFWKALAAHCGLDVVLLKAVETGRSWVPEASPEYRMHILGSVQIYIKRLDWALNLSFRRIWSLLNSLDPQIVVIGGWSSPGYWVARWWALYHRRPMILWMESNTLSSRTRGNWLFNAIKHHFVSRFSGYYVFGRHGADYLRGFGARPERIVQAYNLPDIDRFASCDKPDATDVPTLVYIGQLIPRKGVMLIPPALADLRQQAWHLIIAGSGELREQLSEAFAAHGLLDRVTFVGELRHDEVAKVYRRSDILLFPSLNEVWGMVVHESLLSGVYVVGTDRAAACHALIRNGTNGQIFSPYSQEDFVRGISAAMTHAPVSRESIRASVAGITMQSEAGKLLDLMARELKTSGKE